VGLRPHHPIGPTPRTALRCARVGVAGDTLGTFRASGYEGQSITICPALDLIVVRLADPPSMTRLEAWRADVVEAFS